MTNVNQSTDAPAERGATGEAFRFDCPFCDDELRATTAESVKEQSTAHLGDRHPAELRSVFAELYSGERCHDDCGHVFSVDEVAGFECPSCGRDNFRPFVRRYLYWQIETV